MGIEWNGDTMGYVNWLIFTEDSGLVQFHAAKCNLKKYGLAHNESGI